MSVMGTIDIVPERVLIEVGAACGTPEYKIQLFQQLSQGSMIALCAENVYLLNKIAMELRGRVGG